MELVAAPPHPLFAIAFSLSFAAVLTIAVKGTAEVFECWIVGSSGPGDDTWFTFGFLAMTLLVLIAQTHLLRRCAQSFDHVILAPAFYVAMCTFSVLTGALFFDEWARSSIPQQFVFAGGFILVLIGILCLTMDHLHTAYDVIVSQHDDADLHVEQLALDVNPSDPSGYGAVATIDHSEASNGNIEMMPRSDALDLDHDLPDDFEELLFEEEGFTEAQPIVTRRGSTAAPAPVFSLVHHSG